jgi:uncharacterized membrane protein
MRERISSSVSFLRATALGGVFFLLPFVFVVYLLGQVYSVVSAIAQPLHAWIPVNSPFGIGVLFCIALGVLVFLCFAAGMIASRAIGKKFSSTLEKQLVTVFPKYAIYKDLLAGNLKHGEHGPTLKPILLNTVDGYRLAFEADRLPNDSVVVFLPGAPDTWIGSVVLVPAARVHAIDLPFNEALGIFERLGRDSSRLLASSAPKLTGDLD